jgi:hypothetical protein
MTTYLFFYQTIFEWSKGNVSEDAIFNMMDLLFALKLKSGMSISAFDLCWGRVVLKGGGD